MTFFPKIAAAGFAVGMFVAALPAQATVFIGLQEAGIDGGAGTGNITTVATNAVAASFNGTYGTFEVNNYSGIAGISPDLLGASGSTQNTDGAGGTIDIYVTRTGITGPVPSSFISTDTSNTLRAGWTIQVRTYENSDNALWGIGGTLLSNQTFNAIGDNVQNGAGSAGAGPYSVTARYTITATTLGGSLSTAAIATPLPEIAAPLPEPATWSMMLVGFGMIGFAARRRGRQTTRVIYAR